ncbi:MAG TPA: hypothetical protein VMT38_07925 [Terracidiphilus sp.]|nr:hypothetical protein [Terracidiphilus sp.]
MNTNPHEPIVSATRSSAEETLRLVAKLPPPDGLEERIHRKLDATPRRGRVLMWPSALRAENSWMRGAAAAAIVFIVAGGGWGVYTRVQQSQPGKVMVMPAISGGFGGAGAIRQPQTLPGPKAPEAIETRALQPKAAQKPATRQHGARTRQPAATDQTAGSK